MHAHVVALSVVLRVGPRSLATRRCMLERRAKHQPRFRWWWWWIGIERCRSGMHAGRPCGESKGVALAAPAWVPTNVYRSSDPHARTSRGRVSRGVQLPRSGRLRHRLRSEHARNFRSLCVTSLFRRRDSRRRASRHIRNSLSHPAGGRTSADADVHHVHILVARKRNANLCGCELHHRRLSESEASMHIDARTRTRTRTQTRTRTRTRTSTSAPCQALTRTYVLGATVGRNAPPSFCRSSRFFRSVRSAMARLLEDVTDRDNSDVIAWDVYRVDLNFSVLGENGLCGRRVIRDGRRRVRSEHVGKG